MKKLITICLLIAISFTANAQQLSSGDYSVYMSNLTYSNISGKIYGDNYSGKQIEGTYTIKKNGNQVASQKFTFMKLSEYSATLNLKESERSGNTLVYDYETKMFEFAGEEYKAKKTKTVEDIILSGILVYAKWLDEE